MTYYTSTKTEGRTASHADGILTVFQGLDIIATLDVPQDAAPATVWEHIDTATVAAPAPAPASSKYPAWFTTLLDEGRVMDRAEFEREAYKGYIAYGLSMTDGHFAPEPLAAWVEIFRVDPVNSTYRQNDARHDLAPYLRSYVAQV